MWCQYSSFRRYFHPSIPFDISHLHWFCARHKMAAQGQQFEPLEGTCAQPGGVLESHFVPPMPFDCRGVGLGVMVKAKC